MAEKIYVVHGTITDKKGNPVKGVRVQVFDEDRKSSPDLLGEVLTDQQHPSLLRVRELNSFKRLYCQCQNFLSSNPN